MHLARRTSVALMCLVLSALPARSLAAGTKDQVQIPDPPTVTSPVEPAAPGMTGESVFRGLVEHSKLRDAALRKYTVLRTYQLSNDHGHVYAQETVQMKFNAPGTKSFSPKSAEGSWLIRKLVFRGLMDSEIKTAGGEGHRRSAIAPSNYTFQLLGEQQVGVYRCYVVQAIPKRKGKYLFKGKIWISMPDYGIVGIEGSPDRKLSFWINKASFVRRYEKVGEFWLPQSDRTVVDVKVVGERIFSIRHWNYDINRPNTSASNSTGPGDTGLDSQ